jgi:hypothetical protein
MVCLHIVDARCLCVALGAVHVLTACVLCPVNLQVTTLRTMRRASSSCCGWALTPSCRVARRAALVVVRQQGRTRALLLRTLSR